MKIKKFLCVILMVVICLFMVACQTSCPEIIVPETLASVNESDFDETESMPEKIEAGLYEELKQYKEEIERYKIELEILTYNYYSRGDDYRHAINEITPTLDAKTAEKIIHNTNKNVIAAMKDSNFLELQKYVHPIKGVRVSCFNEASTRDVILSSDSLLLNQKYDWDVWAGGESISMSFSELFDTFLWAGDYSQYAPIYNPVRSPDYYRDGNAYIGNEYIFYDKCISVLYYYEGNDEWARVDWRALKLIYQEHSDGDWYLTGIIHSEREL